MTEEQIKSIKLAFDALNGAISTIHDCHDLWLSDVRDMETALWALHNHFKDICCKEANDD